MDNHGLAFAFGLWGIIVFLIVVMMLVPRGNQIENSTLFRGYSSVGIYKIYDAETGVYYAVTDKGYITPLYNADGTLEVVD